GKDARHSAGEEVGRLDWKILEGSEATYREIHRFPNGGADRQASGLDRNCAASGHRIDERLGARVPTGEHDQLRGHRLAQRRRSFALRLLDAYIKWRTHHEALELRFHHPVCAARTRQAKLITSMRAQPSPPGSTFCRLNFTRSASTSISETSHPAAIHANACDLLPVFWLAHQFGKRRASGGR